MQVAENLYSKEFQLFVQNVLIEDLQKEKFKVLCFHLDVPRRTLDGVTDKDRSGILWYLKDQLLIEKWREEPALLEEILSNVLKRFDLSNKLQELVKKHTPQSATLTLESAGENQVPIQESTNDSCKDPPIQETHDSSESSHVECIEQDGCLAVQGERANGPCSSDVMPTLRQTDAVNKRPRRRHGTIDKERRHGIFEPVPEEEIVDHDDKELSDSGVIVSPERNELCSPSSPEKKDFWKFFQSEQVQEDYGKKTVTGVVSDFMEHLRHPMSHTSLSRTPSNVSKASGRSSGYYSIRSSDARLSQLSLDSSLVDEQHRYTNEEFEEVGSPSPPFKADVLTSHDELYMDPFAEDKFRSRSSSLPSNSQKVRSLRHSQGISRCPRTSSSSSSTSLASDDSETTNTSSGGSQYNSQSSLFGYDATNAGGGSKRKVSPHVRYHPLTEIMGRMELSAKDIRKDISKQKRREHKSLPFLHSKDLQYEMRFYPLLIDKPYAALYIDIATESCKKGCERDEGKQCNCEFEVPKMNVKVSIHSRESEKTSKCDGMRNHDDSSVCIVTEEAQVEGMKCTFKSKKTIASFPNLVSVEELRSIKKGRIIAVEVVMKLV